MNGQFDSNKRDIFNFDEKRKAAHLEDVLTHNALLHVVHGERQAKCFENVVRVYAEFFQNPKEYREAARQDFNVCVQAHKDMKEAGLL